MLLKDDDFREVFGAGGERFERLMKDLVRTEARRLGLAENDVHWDQRTNVPDGGCDIWVTKGHADAATQLRNSSKSPRSKNRPISRTIAFRTKRWRSFSRAAVAFRNSRPPFCMQSNSSPC